MVTTILDYLKEYGDVPFSERPMTDVDSLILCQLSYLKFDGLVPDIWSNRRSVTLREIAENERADDLFADERYERKNRALFGGMLGGRRFAGLRLNCYINIVEKKYETQFSAVTYLLGDGTMYVAFRGTDETIVGWKEDFNMAFLSPVPGQELSVKYLNMVTGKLRNPFYIGGHSKGGNLAIYSAMRCAPCVQNRILRIYSMDGPGFRRETMAACGYERIADRVVKLVPHSSLIGMLFEQDDRYRVVESRSFGMGQHDPYNWIVRDGDFVYEDDVRESVREADGTLNKWILTLDEDQIRTFVETLYRVVSATQADDLITLTADWHRSMNGMISAMQEVDEDTLRVLRDIVKRLFDIDRTRRREKRAAAGEKLLGSLGLAPKRQKPTGSRRPPRPAAPAITVPDATVFVPKTAASFQDATGQPAEGALCAGAPPDSCPPGSAEGSASPAPADRRTGDGRN